MSKPSELAVVSPTEIVVSKDYVQEQQTALYRARTRANEAERELVVVKESRRLVGERLQQLEAILTSHFARSVKMLSGSRRQLGESQDAAQVVATMEDHFRALKRLNEQGVACDTVEAGVRLLLDQRDRVIDMPTDRPPAREVVEVRVQDSAGEDPFCRRLAKAAQSAAEEANRLDALALPSKP